MYLAASPPLFSPLMGPLDVTTGRPVSSSSYRRPASYGVSSHHHNPFRGQLTTLDFDFGNMTISPALESSLLGRRVTSSTITSSSPFSSMSSMMARPSGFGSNSNNTLASPSGPLRSCLVVRTDETDGSSAPSPLSTKPDLREDEERVGPSSPVRPAKKVVFADARGLSLTQVKMMTEPSDCPPRWTAEFLEQVTGGASAEVAADRWELTFAQPASDYMDFRCRLDKQSVSLENVLVQEADQQLVGTVKVKNLAFTKRVTIRVTFDNWASQTDTEAVYVPSGPIQGPPAINLYDTFSFKLAIPSIVPSSRIQFCIRFASDAGEFWDNNLGKNYVIVKPDTANKNNNNNNKSSSSHLNSSVNRRSSTGLGGHNKYPDLLTPGAKVDLWADFASWNHLVNDSPYW